MSRKTGTVRLHRVLRAPATRVYKAFTDKSALERWLPPFGFTGTIHEIDVRVGSGYRMSFTNFGTGSSHAFSVEYVELVPDKHIRHTDRFDSDNLPGEMLVSIDLAPVLCGTELAIVQEEYRLRSRRRCAIWAGRSRFSNSPIWSNQTFPTTDKPIEIRVTFIDGHAAWAEQAAAPGETSSGLLPK